METVAYQRREAEAVAFFDGSWSEEKRRAFLCEGGVDYVWWGPMERALSGAGSFELLDAASIFEDPVVSVFSVEELCSGDEK
jgi:uncharacterized membrane protein